MFQNSKPGYFPESGTVPVFSAILILLLCISCARHPKSGEYCSPNFEDRDCILLDFKSGTIGIFRESYPLSMITGARYEFRVKNEKYSVIVINENRLEISGEKQQDGPVRIYLHKKEDRATQRKRFGEYFKKLFDGKN